MNHQYTQRQHQHVELIRQLEQQNFIFAQNPKLITETLKTGDESAYDKLFLRAVKIDSTGELMDALENSQLYIRTAVRMLYMGYFLFALLGVAGLLSSQVVNFFYVLIALLGWHTLSLVFWLISLGRRRPSLFGLLLEKSTLRTPIAKAFGQNTSQQAAIAVIEQSIAQKKKWHIAKVMHGAWLFGLLGSLLGLLGLFLFKRYDFVWGSTLLQKHHFEMMVQILGFLPKQFGLTLPDLNNPKAHAATFAWLIIASIGLYGIFPRLLAYLISHLRANGNFTIDTNLPYYQELLNKFSKQVIDQDDYQPSKPISKQTQTLSDRLIGANFEYPNSTPTKYVALEQFGVVDDADDIAKLLALAASVQAQIYLGVSTHRPPDRGSLRKIDQLANNPQGLAVELIGLEHLVAWQTALIERNIIIVDGE